MSILGYVLILKQAATVQALSTVGSSNSSNSSGKPNTRHVVVSSNGITVVFYVSTTTSQIYFKQSSDNAATWSPAVFVTGSASDDFAVAIDSNDSIYITYTVPSSVSGTGSSVDIRKLSYSQGSWAVGNSFNVMRGGQCQLGSLDGDNYLNPQVAINSDNKVFVYGVDSPISNYDCLSYGSGLKNISSFAAASTLSGWQLADLSSLGYGDQSYNMVAAGKSIMSEIGGYFYGDRLGDNNLTYISNIPGGGSDISMAYSLDRIDFSMHTFSGIQYLSYSLVTNTFSSATQLSYSSQDTNGAIVTDSQNIWVTYSEYWSTSQTKIVYIKYNGTAWDAGPTYLATNVSVKLYANAPERVPSTSNVPVIWATGTATPYTIEAANSASLGTITDSGNQLGNYTGSLTGSNGDVMVKCGTWYYNTVNIVSGMTLKVCSSDGQTGGSLTIYANSITIAGTVDGSGRGKPGGISLPGAGGASGYSPLSADSAASGSGASGMNGYAGLPGGIGLSYAGVAGVGLFAGSGGSAAATNGSGGSGGSAGNNTGSGGGPGGPGGGSSSVGGNGTNGGYNSAASNGDSSTDISLIDASGGGGGGTGGSGGGGGSGGSGGIAPFDYGCGGPSGGGGQGANGGSGGKGGNAGATIKLISKGTVTVSGAINSTGQAGSSGQSGSAGSDGGGGLFGTHLSGAGFCGY